VLATDQGAARHHPGGQDYDEEVERLSLEPKTAGRFGAERAVFRQVDGQHVFALDCGWFLHEAHPPVFGGGLPTARRRRRAISRQTAAWMRSSPRFTRVMSARTPELKASPRDLAV
jgi:hypothetical protein